VAWDLNNEGPGAEAQEGWGTRLNFAANGELFSCRYGACFRWRIDAGTPGAPPALERLGLVQPAGIEALAPMSAGVVFNTKRGSKLVAYDQLAAKQDGWKPTPNGPISVSPDGRWLGVYRAFMPYSYIYRLPEFERVAKFTNQ